MLGKGGYLSGTFKRAEKVWILRHDSYVGRNGNLIFPRQVRVFRGELDIQWGKRCGGGDDKVQEAGHQNKQRPSLRYGGSAKIALIATTKKEYAQNLLYAVTITLQVHGIAYYIFFARWLCISSLAYRARPSVCSSVVLRRRQTRASRRSSPSTPSLLSFLHDTQFQHRHLTSSPIQSTDVKFKGL